MRKHWYDIHDTGCEAYPKYYLTHWAGSKKYTIMVLAWDLAENKAKGWIRQAEFDTIKECREYMQHF